jgi:hypothetical protein
VPRAQAASERPKARTAASLRPRENESVENMTGILLHADLVPA